MPGRGVALPFLALAFLCLVLGVWSGLVRVGWPWPTPTPDFWLAHGPLMVSGFVGTLIAVERAAALPHRAGFAAPALTATGALALLVPGSAWTGPALIVGGSAVLALLFVAVLVRQPAPATAAMLLGAVAWVVGNALWLASYPALDIDAVVLWWMGFLVLLIAAERLELSRIVRLPRGATVGFLLLADAFLVGAAWAAFGLPAGSVLSGLSLVGLSAWLLRFDVSRTRVHEPGLGRFLAATLLPGYVWLGLGGLFVAASVLAPFPLVYDAMLHAVFLGFVISMVFAHAPIIFPALLGVPLPFRRAFYGHVLLLHAGLALRIAGDILASDPARQWGALLNGAALIGFLASTGAAVVLGARRERPDAA